LGKGPVLRGSKCYQHVDYYVPTAFNATHIIAITTIVDDYITENIKSQQYLASPRKLDVRKAWSPEFGMMGQLLFHETGRIT
jgi:hypothetical protein